ncbi:hypothetical protein [Pseudoxanthomonas putridarboris]|uniref:Uncharacterized protein n=1 Tax=Pseudoxanthomonas putridarboris TaxID=752605 RepID=A0ABU9J3D7_9GAMM
MTTHTFIAQDESGRRCRIQVTRDAADAASRAGAASSPDHAPVYVLEDGSRVRRIDNDTFQVIATGAYVTRVAE